MKIRAILILLAAVAATTAQAQPSVGVSVDIRQPGVYGRIEIGNLPPPPVVYARPVLIVPAPVAVQQQPLYLYVPPGHQKNWAKHCARYSACGQPVYFVQERWVAERYDEEHGRRGQHDKKGKGKHGDD